MKFIEQVNQFFRKIMPPVYFLGAFVLMIIASYVVPISHLVYTPLRIAGVLLAIIGLFLGCWSVLLFRNHATPLKPFEHPVHLVHSGPYQFSRNPIYLGMVLVLAGTWIALGTFSPFILLIMFFYIIQEAFIKEEERFLMKHLGDEYREYSRSVRRWI